MPVSGNRGHTQPRCRHGVTRLILALLSTGCWQKRAPEAMARAVELEALQRN
jgi:hypothetical protein